MVKWHNNFVEIDFEDTIRIIKIDSIEEVYLKKSNAFDKLTSGVELRNGGDIFIPFEDAQAIFDRLINND